LVKKVELKAVKNIDEVNQGVNELKFKEMQSEITKLNQELLNLKENDEMVNKINNMNRFFHDRLLDERNKSSLIMSKLKSCELENEVLKKNLNLLIGDINYDRSTAGLIRDIQTRYTALKQTAVDSNVHFSNEIAQFAP
jgi:phosphomevalonate kinase